MNSDELVKDEHHCCLQLSSTKRNLFPDNCVSRGETSQCQTARKQCFPHGKSRTLVAWPVAATSSALTASMSSHNLEGVSQGNNVLTMRILVSTAARFMEQRGEAIAEAPVKGKLQRSENGELGRTFQPHLSGSNNTDDDLKEDSHPAPARPLSLLLVLAHDIHMRESECELL